MPTQLPKLFPTSMTHVPLTAGSSRVSIIMRTKNRPVLLARALASVLAQTYPNWQLCVVNDGGEVEPVSRLVRQNSKAFSGRITVIHHEASRGMEAASNAGLKVSDGDYVIIHDDDDSWAPEFLERTVRFLEEPHNARFAAVATSCIVVWEKIMGDRVERISTEPWRYSKNPVDIVDLAKRNLFPPITLLIRKSVFERLGPYNESLPVLGDWEFNLRIFTLGDIGFIADQLAMYHHRPSQTGAYANSIIGGTSLHGEFNVLLRNSMARMAIQEDPSVLGTMSLLSSQFDRLEHQLESMNYELQSQARLLAQTLRPLRWFWRKSMPLRKIVARVRGKI